MRALPPLSIRRKLIGISALFMAALLGVGAYNLASTRAIHGAMGEVRAVWLPGLRAATALEDGLGQLRNSAFEHILATDEDGMAKAEQAYAAAVEAIARTRQAFGERASSSEARALLETFGREGDAYATALKEIFGFSRQYAKEAAAAFYKEKASGHAASAAEAAGRLVSLADAGTQGASLRADAAAGDALRLVGLIVGATVLLGLAAAVLLVRSVSRGIDSVIAPMRALADGDLSAAVPHRGEATEIGTIADGVQAFKEALVEKRRADAAMAQEADLKTRRTQAVEGVIRRFEASAEALTQSLAASAESLEGTARGLTESAAVTNAQALGVASAADETSINVQTVASATEELAASIQEITRQVMDSSQASAAAVANVRQADDIIQGLAASAERIGSVVALISGVASQTNLLALNATIEAARAGEAGRGFAVVASEVKALANQTTTATNEIAQQIEQIQGATQQAVAAIREVAAVIAGMNGTAVSVSAAMEEQGAATAEIARSVQDAAAGTQQVSASVHGVKGAAESAGEAATRVLDAARAVARHSGDLQRQVQSFLGEIRAA